MKPEDLSRHPSEFGVLPFIFYPTYTTEAMQAEEVARRLSHGVDEPNGQAVVTIALYDGHSIDMTWADDPVIGAHPYIPGVDILVDEPERCQFVFNSHREAIAFVRNWWANAKCSDYVHFTR